MIRQMKVGINRATLHTKDIKNRTSINKGNQIGDKITRTKQIKTRPGILTKHNIKMHGETGEMKENAVGLEAKISITTKTEIQSRNIESK